MFQAFRCFKNLPGLLALAILCQSGFAQDHVASDLRLPGDVYLYLSTPDMPATFDQFQQTPYGQLIYGPEMAAFREHLLEKLHEKAGEDAAKAEEELGMPLSDLGALIDGDGTLAVIRPAGGALALVAFLDTGDHADITDALEKHFDEQLQREDNVAKSTKTIRDTKVTVLTVATGSPELPSVEICYFIKDGELVISSSDAAADSVLERWDGKHPETFAGNRLYQQVLKSCATTDGETPDMIWFVRPVELILGTLQSIPQTQFYGAMAAGFLPQFGINTLRGVGATVEVNSQEFSAITRSLVVVDQPARGIFKIFELRPTFREIPAWVPGNAAQFMQIDWNLVGAYDTIENLYDTWVGKQPGSFDAMIEDLTSRADGFDLNIKNDIVDGFSGRVEGFMMTPPVDEPTKFEGVIALGIADGDKVGKVVEVALQSADAVREGDVAGREVKIATVQGLDLAIAQTDEKLYIASGISHLKQALGGEPLPDSLVQSNGFATVKPHLPEKFSVFSYQAPVQSFKGSYEQLRNGDFDSAVEGEVDFSLLPPFEQVAKYFVPTFSYSTTTDEGTFSQQFMLKLEE